MKLTRLAAAAAVAWSFAVLTAQAQVAQPNYGQNVSFDYYYQNQPSPSDQPVAQAPEQAPAAPATGGCPSNGCACDSSCCNSCCGDCLCNWPCGCLLSDLGEAWKICQPCCEDSPYVAGGWIAQSFVWNPYSPADRFNGPMTWTDRSNDYQMNELWWYMGKATKTEGCGWDWGYRMDAFYGTNYRWDTSSGFETKWGSNGSFYGIAVPQAYFEVAYNDLTIKAGRFFSPVGYYMLGQANNFFAVLPYTFQYGEPFTHTGVYGTYKASDELTVGLGVTHGWDNTDNFGNPFAGALATATWTIDECRSLAYVGVAGNEPNNSLVNVQNNGVGYSTRYLQTLVYQQEEFSDDVLWVLQSDYGRQRDAITAGNDAEWYGANTYLYWNMTCQCQWGLNLEWFRDDGGFRVGQVLPSFGSPNGRGYDSNRGTANTPGQPGFNGSFYRAMFGPKYYFTPNMYGRAAFAADYYGGAADPIVSSGGNLPYADGTKRHQEVIVFDWIATF